jgi:hypothetical protein
MEEQIREFHNRKSPQRQKGAPCKVRPFLFHHETGVASRPNISGLRLKRSERLPSIAAPPDDQPAFRANRNQIPYRNRDMSHKSRAARHPSAAICGTELWGKSFSCENNQILHPKAS